MNKCASDSASLPRDLPMAGWGHALAAMHSAPDAQQSLADVIAALPANAVHEILAASRADAPAMAGFGVMLALMLAGDAPCFFVKPARADSAMLYPPGLAQLGLDPGRCYCVHAPDLLAALRATADIARSDAAGAVLVEIDGNPRLLDLTASRRLALAAEKSGTAVLLLRNGAREAPGAVFSRWQVAAAPSLSDRLSATGSPGPLPHPTSQSGYSMGGRVGEWAGTGTPIDTNAPGSPAFAVTLLRHRRMAAGQAARLVWNFEERRFDEQAATNTPAEADREAASSRLVSVDARRAADQKSQRAA